MTATAEDRIDWQDDEGEPLECGDCKRSTFYNYADEAYHHAHEPERGCFLIPAEPDRWKANALTIAGVRIDLEVDDMLASGGGYPDPAHAAKVAIEGTGPDDLDHDVRRALLPFRFLRVTKVGRA